MNDGLFNVLYNSSAVILGCCQEMRACGKAFGKGEARDIVIQNAVNLLRFKDTKIRRAAAQALALLAQTEGTGFADELFQYLTKNIGAGDANLLSGIALAIAHIHDVVGSEMVSKYLPFTIATLQTLSIKTNPTLSCWILHSLSKIIKVSGVEELNDYLQTIEAMVVQHACQVKNDAPTYFMYTIGKLVWSFFDENTCKMSVSSLIRRFLENFGDARVEGWSVFLFEIPKGNSVELDPKVIKSLQTNLRSSGCVAEEALKILERICKNEKKLILESNIFFRLFELFDDTRGSMQEKTGTVLENSLLALQTEYSQSLANVLREVIVGGKQIAATDSTFGVHFLSSRWSTQIFACECLGKLMKYALEKGGPHISLIEAREHPEADEYLSKSFQMLTTLILRVAGSSEIQIQIAGYKLVELLIQCFSSQTDPDAGYSGCKLLDQYQAPIHSIFKPKPKSKSSNPLSKVELMKTTLAVIESPLATTGLCNKIIEEWVDLLDTKKTRNLWSNIYGSHMTTIVILSSLRSLCSLDVLLKEDGQKIQLEIKTHIIKLLEPYQENIRELAVSILKDLMVAISVPRRTLRDYEGKHFHGSDAILVKTSFQELCGPLVQYLLAASDPDSEFLLDLLLLILRNLKTCDLEQANETTMTYLSTSLKKLVNDQTLKFLTEQQVEAVFQVCCSFIASEFKEKCRRDFVSVVPVILRHAEKNNFKNLDGIAIQILQLIKNEISSETSSDDLLIGLFECFGIMSNTYTHEQLKIVLSLIQTSLTKIDLRKSPQEFLKRLCAEESRRETLKLELISLFNSLAETLQNSEGRPSQIGCFVYLAHVLNDSLAFGEEVSLGDVWDMVLLLIQKALMGGQVLAGSFGLLELTKLQTTANECIWTSLLPTVLQLLLTSSFDIVVQENLLIYFLFCLNHLDVENNFCVEAGKAVFETMLHDKEFSDDEAVLARRLLEQAGKPLQSVIEGFGFLCLKKEKKREKKRRKKKKQKEKKQKGPTINFDAF